MSAGAQGAVEIPPTRSTPDLTIVTLTMNEPDRLLATAESVDAQVDVDIQHIIVNGGRDIEVLPKLPLGHRLVLNDDAQGIYPAMNLGLDLATGAAVMFLHSGDRLFRSDSARRALDLLGQSSWGYGSLVATSGGRARTRRPRPWDAKAIPLGVGYIPHPSTIMTTGLLRQLGGFDPGLGVSADQWAIYRASLVERPATTRSTLAIHRQDGLSATRNPKELDEECLRMRGRLDEPVLMSVEIDSGVAALAKLARSVRARLGEGRTSVAMRGR